MTPITMAEFEPPDFKASPEEQLKRLRRQYAEAMTRAYDAEKRFDRLRQAVYRRILAEGHILGCTAVCSCGMAEAAIPAIAELRQVYREPNGQS